MEKQELFSRMEELEPLCREISTSIWENPETGGEEQKSSDFFRTLLSREGFVIVNEEKLPYAFYAEYGSGSPVIGVLGEYDALPGLSQKCTAKKEAVVEGGPGHGCGHNLLGAASATAAVALKRFLEETGLPGTIRFYGCPEEELLSGKVKMAYYHMFDGCDLALSWHPMSANMVYDEGYLASASVKFKFYGKTSHAAAAPEKGRSALDAVELMSVGANYLREHVPEQARIHYTTDSGGFAPNIVPDRAGAWYYVRAPYMEQVKEILRRLTLVAEGAAMMTETRVETRVEYGCCEMKGEPSFGDVTWQNLQETPLPVYTEEEKQFARQLQEAAGVETEMPLREDVLDRMAWKEDRLTASSDSGDVSRLMPMNMFTAVCWPDGVAPHTWQSCAAAGSTIGQKGAFYAARVLAGTGWDLYQNPELVKKIREEFQAGHPGDYQPMYEERKAE